MNKKILYTTVFGNYDDVIEPKLQNSWDWKCFSEENSLSLYTDNNRNAKRFKVLPHRYFQDYEYSIFIDGNMLVVGNIDELVEKYLSDSNVAFFDHSQNQLDPRDCIYEESSTILQLGIKNGGNYKDNPELIAKQMTKYQTEGYPEHNGLVVQMEVLRRHNETDVVDSMEDQWVELKYNSKREQLSFNYIAWKNNLKFGYIQGDSRDNKYFLNMGAHTGKK